MSASSGRSRPSRSGNPAVRSAARPTPTAGSAPGRRGLLPELALPEVRPPAGASYPQVLRRPELGWRGALPGLLGVLCGLSLFYLLTTLVSQLVIGIGWSLTGRDQSWPDYYRRAVGFQVPAGMLGVNLGIATLIPIAWALVTVVHGSRPRWLSSVQPRLRWRYLIACLVVALVSLNGVLLLSQVVTGRPALAVQPGLAGFLVVILLTSPLQAAAEEYFFRGYLLQAFGSFSARPWVGIVGSSVVFALMHGTQNLPLFVDRLAFGLLAATLVWRTGGLEAGIAAHVVNNVFAYLIAGLTTGIAALQATRGIGWVDALFDVGGFALFAVLAHLVARRLRLRDRVAPVAPGLGRGGVL